MRYLRLLLTTKPPELSWRRWLRLNRRLQRALRVRRAVMRG